MILGIGEKGSLPKFASFVSGLVLVLMFSCVGYAATLPSKTIKVLPTDDVVVIGWIDGSRVAYPSGANLVLQADLFSVVDCLALEGIWLGTGSPAGIVTEADREFANAFLIKNSANQAPPLEIDPDAELAAGDFRAFSRFQAAYSVNDNQILSDPKIVKSVSILGKTPEPCTHELFPSVAAEENAENGITGITADGTRIFQITEGRLGSKGQKVNQTINGRSTPWIWSVTEFDLTGVLVYPTTLGSGKPNHQMFPTYYVYRNGAIYRIFGQSDLQPFINLDDSSQISRSDP